MARYGLFVLKVPLNPNQPTNRTVWQATVKLGMVTHVEEGRVSEGSGTSLYQGVES